MTNFEANRMKSIPFSSIRQVFEQVNHMEATGHSVVPFHIGRPDFDTPDHIKAAAKQALDDGMTTYTSNYGLLELRVAIADKLLSDNHMQVDPENQIIVTVGANEAILLAMLATLNPGDEVLIPEPMWLHYFYCAQMAGARVISVPLLQENGFQLDPEMLEQYVTPRTRMMVLNSPHNPTGVVFNSQTIREVADFVKRHDLLLLSDEIYEKIIYDNEKHISPGAMEDIADRTITINGFSKSYAMTGWRLGYVVASPELIKVMIRVHQYTTVCATSFAQAGALTALTSSQESVDNMVAEFDKRRRVILQTFKELTGAKLLTPRGAFYAFPDLSALNPDSETLASTLLEDVGIAVVPGKVFGKQGEGHIRISYACSLENVERGMGALKQYWEENIS